MNTTEEIFNYNALPKNISETAIPFIGFLGLNIENNPIHEKIWTSFSSKRQGKTLMTYKLLDDDFELPPQKPKKQSYEWYSPKGILKSNWVDKYTKHIPSLVVLFHELDWDDSNWVEKRQKLIEILAEIKIKFVNTRNIPRSVVLLQTSSATITGDDCTATERASGLCATASLPPKHLFVLPISDSHFSGYALRLESALHEILCGFFNNKIKGIKLHKDFLNKTNQHLLFIRHQFKLGFHNEMRFDHSSAIKYYEQAYNLLFEHKITDTNLHEVRMAAAIINYKICHLNFTLSLPRDAIKQFRRHVDMFRQRTGPKEIIFEHYGWTCEQYKMFGNIFEEAVVNGMPAVQTQNPGFYYQQAAFYGVLRRSIALEICKNISTPTVDLLEGWEYLEYYGQRPWRAGKHRLEPPELEKEVDGHKALCYHEVNVWKHSVGILSLYMSAIVQFRKYKCPRIKKYLMVEMSKEYIINQEYTKALNMLKIVMWDYRKERWIGLLSSCLMLVFKCSYELASKSDYIESCLEILNNKMKVPESDKAVVQAGFAKLLMGHYPSKKSEACSDVQNLWAVNCKSPVTIDMNDLFPAIQIKASFKKSLSPMDEELLIVVDIRSLLSTVLQLQKLSVRICPNLREICEDERDKLILQPLSTLQVIIIMQPSWQDVQQTLKISSVSLSIGEDSSITLQWAGSGNQPAHPDNITWKYKEFSLKQRMFEHDPLTEVLITSRQALLEIKLDYDDRALVWEWLPIKVTLLNEEVLPITDIYINMNLQSSEISLQRTTLITTKANLENKLSTTAINNFPVEHLKRGDEKSAFFYIKSLNVSQRNFQLEVNYICVAEDGIKRVKYPVTKIETFSITAKMPFQVSIEAQSLKFSNVTKVSKGENFLIVPKISCFSHVPITIVDSELVLANGVAVVGESQSQVASSEISDKEEATDCFCVSSNFIGELQLGQYLCYWKRLKGESPVVSVSISLPKVVMDVGHLLVTARLPSNGHVKKPMSVNYEVTNVSSRMLEVIASIDVSDSFMYSGCKEIRMRLVANMTETLSFNVYPLLVGFVQLPKLNIIYDVPGIANTLSLAAYLSRSIPTHIFIMPQERHNTENLPVIPNE